MRFRKPPAGTQIKWGHPLTYGLTGCWLLNEGAGWGVNDLTGNTKPGLFLGGSSAILPKWVDGPNGPCLELEWEGTAAAANAGVQIYDPAGRLAFNPSRNGFTIVSYAYIEGLENTLSDGRQVIFHKGANTGGNGYSCLIRKSSGTWYPGIVFMDVIEKTAVDTSMVLAEGRWYFFAWVVNTDNTVRFYLDDKSYLHTNTSAIATTNIERAWIGVYNQNENSTSLVQEWDGKIDYVYAYNRVLSQNELMQLRAEPYQMFLGPRLWVPAGVSLKGKITAADAEVTYSTIKGKITAVDAEATYSTVLGKITAVDAEVTYELRSGKITAADLDLTYDPIKARIVAADSEITYSTVLGKIVAADLDITYTPVTGKVTAVDAEITYSVTGVPTGRITAADAEITYSTISGKITAIDAEVAYDTVKGKVTAADAEITFTPRGSKITAADIEIIYTPVAGKVTAADAEITYDPVIAKITASDAEISYDTVKGKIVAADAEITYTISGQAAKITAADLVITFSTTEYQQLWPKIRRRGSYLIPHREPRLLGSPRRKET